MEEKLTIKQVGMRYGIYLALVSIIYSILLQILVLGANKWLGYIAFVFIIIALIIAHNDYKKSNTYMSYGDGFKISMLIVFISTVASSIVLYLYIKFIDNSMIEMIRQQSEEQMHNSGMSDEQIEQALAFSSKFTTPEMILFIGIFFGLFIGLIIGLIITAITKKENPQEIIG